MVGVPLLRASAPAGRRELFVRRHHLLAVRSERNVSRARSLEMTVAFRGLLARDSSHDARAPGQMLAHADHRVTPSPNYHCRCRMPAGGRPPPLAVIRASVLQRNSFTEAKLSRSAPFQSQTSRVERRTIWLTRLSQTDAQWRACFSASPHHPRTPRRAPVATLAMTAIPNRTCRRVESRPSRARRRRTNAR